MHPDFARTTGRLAGAFVAVLVVSMAIPSFAAHAARNSRAAVRKPAMAPALPTAATRPANPQPDAPDVAEATTEQLLAAEHVHHGHYGCEFRQSITVRSSTAYPAYVELTFGARVFLMRPVLSSTGAIRLEDVLGETLVVQIPVKSMLLDVREGRRLVDDCISADQAQWNEAQRETRALAARAAALPIDADDLPAAADAGPLVPVAPARAPG